ncbi:MAG: T9SS type A sorting domain-containing protein [Sphingobacteriales bacterium JAD_PAG50586_3]|nr:MAG: T9SS type A sorting domain-containing protein [Sphingobacteriales bacterium JAD_PAG50586_3]
MKNYCQNLGCTNVVQNKFSGLAKGVMVRNTLDIPFSGKVTKSKFQNNLFGTVAFGGNTIRITENDFFMRTDSLYDFIAAGVALFGNTGYVVTENNFTRLGNVSGPNTFGVAVVNSGDFDNEIRLNNFDSLGFASYSEGDNRGPAVSNGLLFKCNSNNKNGYDIFVEATDTVDQGIAENQGSDINTESVAGNVFSRYSLSTEVDFINNGGPINYFHHDSTSNAFVKPLDKIGVITLVDTEIDYTVGSCLSFINETKPTIKLRIANNASNLFPRLTIHNSLTDNGNTGSLINRIDTTSTASKASLRTYLLSLSPYLSNESLLHAASLNAFDNADIVDILTVNPHGSRYQRLVDTLSTKIKPFNVGQLQDIGDLQANITGRDTLIANINFLNTDRKSNIEELIYLHLTDTAYNGLDSSIAILRGENTLWSGYKLVSCYLQNGQDNYAMNVLDSLPIRYKISGVELKNYRDYKYLVRKADSLGTIKNSYKWNNLDSSSIARLQTMSNTNAFWSGMQACNILMLIGVDTCTVQLNASIVSPRLAQDIDVSSPIKQVSPKENFMKLYPNPAQGTVNVKYELNKLTNNQTFIEIYTLTGAKTYSQNLSGVTGTIQIDISNLQQGLYFVVLKNGSTIVGADKLIVN